MGEKLRRMSAELTLRCVLAGILAVVLLHVGLVADRLMPPLAALDPDAAPAAFYLSLIHISSGSWLATAYGGQWTPEALKTELGVTTTSYLIQNGCLLYTSRCV